MMKDVKMIVKKIVYETKKGSKDTQEDFNLRCP